MKIWCVDYAGLSYHISSHLFFTKAEAEDFYESRNHCGNYVKMYQVEDIWGWCGRHFEDVIAEVMASRDNGDNFTYIYGLVKELEEAAAHCGLKTFNINAFWTKDDGFVLSIAWISKDKLYHRTYELDAIDERYEYPTIVERRSKWEK
jgi:hypothetical protein